MYFIPTAARALNFGMCGNVCGGQLNLLVFLRDTAHSNRARFFFSCCARHPGPRPAGAPGRYTVLKGHILIRGGASRSERRTASV